MNLDIVNEGLQRIDELYEVVLKLVEKYEKLES